MKRVLALRQDNNGDVTLAGPALRALATTARVTLVCGPSGEGAARLLPDIDDVIVARAAWIEGDALPVDRLAIDAYVRDVARRSFDEAFIFTSFHQSPLPAALLLRLAGVPRIAAYSVDYPGSLLDVRLQPDDDLHEVERALRLVRSCGYALPAGDAGKLAYGALPDIRRFDLPERYVVMQPGATVAARTWPRARWQTLAEGLTNEGYALVVAGDARETELTNAIANAGRARDLGGRTSFAEFAALVAGAEAIIAGNTSGAHVAAAVGTRVVSIFPPTILPQRFAPWHVSYVMLGDHDIACAGCRARVCPVPSQPCIGCVTDTDVFAALRALDVMPRATSIV